LRILVVNSYVDQARFTEQMANLCAQIEKNCEAQTETVTYGSFNPEYVKEETNKFDGVVISGSEALYSRPEDRLKFSDTIEAIRTLKKPLLGICGGHQLIGMAYGERIAPIGRSIKGYRDIEILLDDPLFEGLLRTASVMQSHQEMVERTPHDFELLARSDDTPIEAFRNRHGIAYGVQFHPERNDNEHSAGASVLKNFGGIVRR